MPRPPTHRSPLIVVVIVALGVLLTIASPWSSTASAHNSLASSTPSDGARLSKAPTSIEWVFVNPVPLDTLTVTLITADGSRRTLPGSSHRDATRKVVVTPLPALTPGSVSLRWRLVGADGHPVTGRVDVTLLAGPASTPPPPAATGAATTSATPTSATPAPSSSSATAARVAPTAAPLAVPSTVTPAAPLTEDASPSTPALLRWLLRFASYLAVMAVVGVLAVGASIDPGIVDRSRPRQVLGWSLLAIGVLSVGQLGVLAADLGGTRLLRSFGHLDQALSTWTGTALAARIAVAAALWIILLGTRLASDSVFWAAAWLGAIGLLITWAMAGHAASLRWPWLGVPADVAHHGAAAAWLAGLVVVWLAARPEVAPDVALLHLRRFSAVALVCVVLVVLTGVIQVIRLTGNIFDLLQTTHGRLVGVKLVLVVMLVGAGAFNRTRLRLAAESAPAERTVQAVRTAMFAEVAVGVATVGLTAGLVVSSPGVR